MDNWYYNLPDKHIVYIMYDPSRHTHRLDSMRDIHSALVIATWRPIHGQLSKRAKLIHMCLIWHVWRGWQSSSNCWNMHVWVVLSAWKPIPNGIWYWTLGKIFDILQKKKRSNFFKLLESIFIFSKRRYFLTYFLSYNILIYSWSSSINQTFNLWTILAHKLWISHINLGAFFFVAKLTTSFSNYVLNMLFKYQQNVDI